MQVGYYCACAVKVQRNLISHCILNRKQRQKQETPLQSVGEDGKRRVEIFLCCDENLTFRTHTGQGENKQQSKVEVSHSYFMPHLPALSQSNHKTTNQHKPDEENRV